MKILKDILIVFLCVVLLFCAIGAWIYADNTRVCLSSYGIYSEKLPQVFDNYKIALITDFHNSKNYDKVLAITQQEKPNIIVIAGDLINMNSSDYSNAGILLKGLVKIAPTYYTFGNHEVWSKDQNKILKFAVGKGVKVLNNEISTVNYESGQFNLIGYKDIGKDDWHVDKTVLKSSLKSLYNKIPDKNLFNVLIFHRANYFDTISELPFDLVLSGHLHNGQIDLPIIQQWLLRTYVNNDKYSKGIYRNNNSQMIVSGGLEENFQKIRIHNTPEVVSVVLHPMES